MADEKPVVAPGAALRKAAGPAPVEAASNPIDLAAAGLPTEAAPVAQAQVSQQTSENIAAAKPPAGMSEAEAQKAVEAAKQAALTADAAALLEATRPKRWKFVKNYGVGDVLQFKDGTTHQFRAIPRNDGFGFATNSYLVTTDETLANNLREVAKNPHTAVVEILL